MNRLGTFAAVGLVLLGAALPAAASCVADERTVDQQIADADIVFVGTVIEVTNKNRTAIFRVEEVWKGPSLPERVKVAGGPETSNAVTSVDRYFDQGVRYLVFPLGDPSEFTDNSCSPTRKWADDLAAHRPLGTAASPGPEPSTESPEANPESSGPPVLETSPSAAEPLVAAREAEGPKSVPVWAWFLGAVAALAVAGAAIRWRAVRKENGGESTPET